MTALALDSDQIGKIGIGIIVGLFVLGALLSLIVTAIVGRIIIAVVVIALAVLTWQQRSSLQDKINKKDCNLSAHFFGFTVKAPDDVAKACADKLKK